MNRLTPSDALWADIARQMREAVERRLDPAAVARRATVRTIKEKALQGVPLDQREWAR